MFRSPKKRLGALLDVVDDMLLGAPDPVEPVVPAIPAHPHRRPARVTVARRGGAVAPRAMHCIAPLRPAPTPVRDAVVESS